MGPAATRLDQQSHFELPEKTSSSGLCKCCWRTLRTYAKMNYLSDFVICNNNSQCFLGALKLQVLENASMENRSKKCKMCKGEKYKYGKIKYGCVRAENASTEKASTCEQGQYYSTYSVLYRPVGTPTQRYTDAWASLAPLWLNLTKSGVSKDSVSPPSSEYTPLLCSR